MEEDIGSPCSTASTAGTASSFASQRMKKTKAELALFAQKSLPRLLTPRNGWAVCALASNKTSAHA
jgi:hypothetical protein